MPFLVKSYPHLPQKRASGLLIILPHPGHLMAISSFHRNRYILYTGLVTCLSICLTTCFFNLPVDLSDDLFINLSINLSIDLSVFPSRVAAAGEPVPVNEWFSPPGGTRPLFFRL
jgi:hypothetical protein